MPPLTSQTSVWFSSGPIAAAEQLRQESLDKIRVERAEGHSLPDMTYA